LETDVALPTADLDFAGAEEPDYANTGDDLADLAADLDLAFDEPEPPSAPAVSEAPAANVPDNDFMADVDEAATKLDLARAYIDMGDRAGARDILDEVVQEGNAEQQEEAKALLKKVG
jgi:pilus assembly protein FimV